MAAPDWYPVLKQAKAELASDVTTIGSKSVTWAIGKIFHNWDMCPCGAVFLGDEVPEVADSGRSFWSSVELHVLLATHSMDAGNEENVYGKAHMDMADFRKAVIDSMHSNITLNDGTNNLINYLTFSEVRVEPPEAAPDEDLQLARVTFILRKKWAE